MEDIKPLSCPKHNFLRNELFFNGFALKEEGSGVGKKLELPTSCVRVYILGSSKAPSSLSIILSGVNSSVVDLIVISLLIFVKHPLSLCYPL